MSDIGTYVVTADGGVAFADGNDRGRIIVAACNTSGAYSIMEWRVAASGGDADISERSFGAHRHNTIEETFLVRSGSLEFLIDDEVVLLTDGDFVRVPPGVRHGYCNTTAEPVDLVVTFVPGGFEELFVKYRTDTTVVANGPDFIDEATSTFASSFEV